MIKIIFVILLLISGCGKKGKLFLEEKEDGNVIQIDEERLYKF